MHHGIHGITKDGKIKIEYQNISPPLSIVHFGTVGLYWEPVHDKMYIETKDYDVVGLMEAINPIFSIYSYRGNSKINITTMYGDVYLGIFKAKLDYYDIRCNIITNHLSSRKVLKGEFRKLPKFIIGIKTPYTFGNSMEIICKLEFYDLADLGIFTLHFSQNITKYQSEIHC